MEPGRLFPDPTAAPAPPRPAAGPLARPSPAEALARLLAGNARFASRTAPNGRIDPGPFAVVIGCIDARVPVETVLGQPSGAICVARSAGHVLDRAVLGSAEFAVTDLQVSLVFVLGHDDCRAVAATREALRAGRCPPGARRFLVDQIAPAISPGDTLDRATRAHLRRTVAALRQSDHLKAPLAAGRIAVAGGIYRLESGHIEML
ncbi:carbonic anhydrase [Actinoplanes sp. CA-054009]